MVRKGYLSPNAALCVSKVPGQAILLYAAVLCADKFKAAFPHRMGRRFRPNSRCTKAADHSHEKPSRQNKRFLNCFSSYKSSLFSISMTWF